MRFVDAFNSFTLLDRDDLESGKAFGLFLVSQIASKKSLAFPLLALIIKTIFTYSLARSNQNQNAKIS